MTLEAEMGKWANLFVDDSILMLSLFRYCPRPRVQIYLSLFTLTAVLNENHTYPPKHPPNHPMNTNRPLP
jgi:hypothetical protein